MKKIATTILVLSSLSSMAMIYKPLKQHSKIIKEISEDSTICRKTFTIQLNGNLTKETSKDVKEYIENKKGICKVQFNLIEKIIYIDVIDEMDFESIKGLVEYCHHLFLLEDDHSK